MAQPQTYQFCFGPWNLSEGADPYGPTTRPPQSFDWKLAQLKKHGFAAMMFHDDDAVPDIDGKSEAQIRKEAAELRKRLDGEGVAAEMVAPRLWFSPMTIDGAYTSNDLKHRQYAIDRSLRSIDIAKILGTDILVLWLAREGSYIRESKNARRCVALLVEAFGNTNLRSAFDQVRALERNGYGSHGEYVCFDVHPFRTTRPEHWMDHLLNSRRTFLRLVDKARAFDETAANQLIADRNYQALDQMVIEHLLGQ